MSRTSVAYSQRPLLDVAGDPLRLFSVGANWTRSEMVKDPVSGLWLPGIRLEPAVTNQMLYSNDISNWTSRWKVTATAAQAVGPMGDTDMWKITEDSSDDSHQIMNWDRGAAQNDIFTLSGWVAQGTRRYAILYALDMDGSNYPGFYVQFDLDNMVFDSAAQRGPAGESELLDYGIVGPYSGDTYRVWSTTKFTRAGITSVNGRAWMNNATPVVSPPRYQGDGSSYWYCGHFQLQKDHPHLTSYIAVPAGANVTRTADSAVVWTIAPTAEREMTLLIPILIPEHTPTADTKLFSVYKDGAAGTDHITAWCDTAGKFKLTSAASGGSAGSLVVNKVISDGNLHWVSVHAKHGQLHGIVDTIHHAADMDAGIAPDMDRLSYEPHGGWSGGVAGWRKFKRTQPRPPQPQLMAA